ncbi:MAG TPA: hypothetical protein VFW07_08605 [Parafilimonas sp.]|nr:hypothetical protein [Parafilimonas sp.]
MKHSKLLLTIICFIFIGSTKADSWIDPSWKRMLDSSDIIALIEYTTTGDFRAQAKILKVYKGKININEHIFIYGFSNRYGPIDTMFEGEKYLVFLNQDISTSKNLEYWNKELKENPGLKDFVNALKNKKAYYLWSPTSGDLKVNDENVQYDLIQTTFYSKQNFYSISEFEAFLNAYNQKGKNTSFTKNILLKLVPVTESDSATQSLMMLCLLGYNQFEDIFEKYLSVKNPGSKYALAQISGNIKSEKSTKILIALLDDKNSIIQGEAVRQLKTVQGESIAPVLLQHLTTAGNGNFGPADIMDPVLNSIDGGKVEIINALAEFKYKPAIPSLLQLLETDDQYLFKLTIEALKNIGSKEYISCLNKKLDNKSSDLIFTISMMIAEDSLVECIPHLKNFISSCNRNEHPSYDYTISTCCGIGHFTDSQTISFLLKDYENFFINKDSVKSDKQKDWLNQYIETFTDLKLERARFLIYRSIYDWHGIDQNFGIYPKLFEIKNLLEDSLKSEFRNKFGTKGYQIDHCIAFIENSADVIDGRKPLVKYLIEVTTQSTNADKDQKIISQKMNLPIENVYMKFSNGVYYVEKQDRFDKINDFTPFFKFLEYAKALPNEADLNFIQVVLDKKIIDDEFNVNEVKRAIDSIKHDMKKKM